MSSVVGRYVPSIHEELGGKVLRTIEWAMNPRSDRDLNPPDKCSPAAVVLMTAVDLRVRMPTT